MSRNANECSAQIFARLTRFAADRGVIIPDGDRRVFLEEEQYNLLISTQTGPRLIAGRHTAAVHYSSQGLEFLALAGFSAENLDQAAHIRETDVLPGLAVALLADLQVEPIASPASVLDVVAAGSRLDPGYQGHDLGLMLSLFPAIRIFEIDTAATGDDAFAANLLTICAAEGVSGNGWINSEMANELVRLGEQRIAAFPYEFLVRAALDLDPTNMFLALYRCLEATYAFVRARDLATKLGIAHSWVDVAKAVGETLSWYPRHDQSLSAVLGLAAVERNDLVSLATALGKPIAGDELASKVASAVRELRNSLVHYGPTTEPVDLNRDWNELCVPLARLVGSVFAHAYGSVGVTSAGSGAQRDLRDRASRPSKAPKVTGVGRGVKLRIPVWQDFASRAKVLSGVASVLNRLELIGGRLRGRPRP